MNPDFHYYATYCAAQLAGYTHEESVAIARSDQFVDLCSVTFLAKVNAPLSAATTQLQLELMQAPTDIIGLQNITRIWSSFHFLPYDLYAEPKRKCSKRYKNKYRLICRPNGDLVRETVMLAKGKSPEAVGIAMHVLADTWAHQNFAGTPSLVINNTNYWFYELFEENGGWREKKIAFRHSASTPDDLDNSLYTASIYVNSEKSIMNLGHGRAGHLPDYSFVRYKYLPAWGDYEEIVKDNPSCAICAATRRTLSATVTTRKRSRPTKRGSTAFFASGSSIPPPTGRHSAKSSPDRRSRRLTSASFGPATAPPPKTKRTKPCSADSSSPHWRRKAW